MRFRHGGLVIDLPETWSDQSTLLFVGAAPNAMLTTPNAVAALNESVAIRFLRGAGDDARAILERELAAIQDRGIEIVEEGAITSKLGTGWSVTMRIQEEGSVLRQIAACFVLGPITILAHASMGELGRKESEPRIRKILESLEAG